jgi:hypothetical protein
MKIGRPKPLNLTGRLTFQTTRGTMCLLLNSSTANWLPVTLGCPYLVTHGSLVGQHVHGSTAIHARYYRLETRP